MGRRIEVQSDPDNKTYRKGHRFGNLFLTNSVSLIFDQKSDKRNFKDMLSGFRVLSRRYVKSFLTLSSGFEIENTRFTDYGDATENIANYINIRDDRANFYFDMKSRETKTFKLLLNASYLGNYYFPGLQCEAMYDHNFLVRTKGFWIEVLK